MQAQNYLDAALSLSPWFVRFIERIVRPFLAFFIFLGATPILISRLGGPPSDFIRLYRSLVFFAFFESPLAQKAIGIELTEKRQLRFRKLRKEQIKSDV